jgi:hypothetical protein
LFLKSATRVTSPSATTRQLRIERFLVPCYVLHKLGETVFEDSSSLEDQTEDGKESNEKRAKERGLFSRWLALIASLAFLLIYLPFRNHPWSWFVAIAGSYTVAVLGIALDSALDFADADDFFGDSRVPRYVAVLLLPHALVLVLIMLGAYLWLCLEPVLPHWITVEGRKGSFWDLIGLLLLLIAAIVEGTSLGSWIKHRFGTPEN